MSTPVRILLALVLGLTGGAFLAHSAASLTPRIVAIAEPIGGMWLDGLRMTIVPLVVSLLITGIASTASAARAGGVAARALAIIFGILWTSSVIGWVMSDLLWAIWPIPAQAGHALREALGAQTGVVPPTPGIGQFLRGIVPDNPIKAAAETQMLPLILFSGVFGFAITRLPDDARALLTNLFKAIAEAMLIVIGWVLWLAPVGVFALALAVGAKAGLSAAGALAHYVATLSAIGITVALIGYPFAAIAGRVALGRFARALLPVQAVAISTQSSLASLPPMLRASEALDVAPSTAGIVLPMAVALLRATGPAMNLGVALYVAHWFGVHLGPAQIAVGIALAATTTLGAVSLPGQVSFVSSIGPIAIALGLPLEPLLLLVAVETIPDIFRTLGNVILDVGLTRVVTRITGNVVPTPLVHAFGGAQ